MENHIIFVVADCTGHGVPGGFIIMLGITYLHGIIRRNETDNVGVVLEILRKRFKEIFKDFGSQNQNGLDIAICAIDTRTNLMQYAGAYNPLVIIRNKELIEYKATRNPIGFYPVEVNFKTHEIQLEKNDMIYLFSDGYQDQFGGENNTKFSFKIFKLLLLEIHELSMKEQKNSLIEVFDKWKGNNDQIDDVLVWGIKI